MGEGSGEPEKRDGNVLLNLSDLWRNMQTPWAEIPRAQVSKAQQDQQ